MSGTRVVRIHADTLRRIKKHALPGESIRKTLDRILKVTPPRFIKKR